MPRSATPDEIKAAYRRLARTSHPDVSKAPDADAQFSKIQAAYDLLSNPEARAQYDRFGHMGAQSRSQGPGRTTYTTTGTGFDPGFDAGEFSDIFESFFGRSTGGRRPSGQGGSARRPASRQGSQARAAPRDRDTKTETTIDFMVAARGGSIELRVPKPAAAHAPGPTQAPDSYTRVTVRIPPGTLEGTRLRVPGSQAGLPGSIIITVHVAEHPIWRRRQSDDPKGNARFDLELTLPITIAEATLGATVRVPTITGSAEVRVPAGSHSGRVLRLRGCAIERPSPKGHDADDAADEGKAPTRGDLYVMLRIVPPHADELSKTEQEQLRSIAQHSGDVRRELYERTQNTSDG